MPISLSTRVVGRDSVHVQTLDDGEAILLDMNSEEYYSLNDTGRYMWQLLESHATIDDALTELVEHVPDEDSETLRRDLIGFVDQLVAHAFVDVESDGTDESAH